jgi:two-component system, LytTR family, response regulator
MKKIKSIIVDDEPGNIVTMQEILKEYCPEIDIAATASGVDEAYDVINAINPDLVFLDIEMPPGNAFDLLDRLEPVNFEIIFVTAFDNYAIKAFKYAALDYILKPVNIAEIKASVKRIANETIQQPVNARIGFLLDNMKSGNLSSQKIGFPTLDGYYFEKIEHIMYLRAEGCYTHVYIKGGKKEVVSRTLKEFDTILPEAMFCRIHNSYTVNMAYISKYIKGKGGNVILEDGTSIEVSARKKSNFMDRFLH